MSKEQSSYRQIFKATSLFGGVQVFNIIISIIRSKIVAILLGPAGMGIFGLFTTTINLIGGITNFGLSNSAIRNIAAANDSNDYSRIAKVVSVVKKLVWLTGLLGSLVTLVLAPWLSSATFGNTQYSSAFYWLAISLLFNQLTVGQNVLLQGMRKLTYLAKANMLGSLLSLVVSIPLYYLYKLNGIVPAMVLTSICSMFISWYYSRNIKLETVTPTRKETIVEAKDMLRMGFLLSVSGFITLGESYLIRIYINNTGSLDDVGFYNAGFAIIGTYVGMVFTAMGTDYYPRLSMVAKDNEKAKELINQQAEIAILLLAPILCVFLIFINWAVMILYSHQFTPVSELIHWAALGMYFKAASWAIGFVFLAKGNGKLFFWSEVAALSYLFLFNVIGYKFWRLEGLGMSFLAAYLVCYFQVFYIAKIKYNFSFHRQFYKIFIIQLTLGLSSFCISRYLPLPWNYIIGTLFIALSAGYSIWEMDKRLDFRSILMKMKSR